MKKTISPLLVLSLVTGCATNKMQVNDVTRSTASYEEHRRPNYNGRYDGPPPGFDREQWDRRPTGLGYCDKYRNDSGKHVLACNSGVEEALKMATRYAGAHGREDGYLRGYAWGMNQGLRYFQDNENEMQRGESDVESLNSYLGKAVSEGQSTGSSDGDSLGTSEAKNRFYSAIDKQVEPSQEYQVPLANFNPTQDAYTRLVGRIPTPEDILKRDRYERINFYDSYDRAYAGPNWRERRGREMWSRDGVYIVNSNQWINGDEAFKIWISIPNQSTLRYNNLNIVSVENNISGRFPADENGQRDHRGPQASQPVTPTVPVVDYQAIFRDAFVQTYNLNARSEYSKNFYITQDIGQKDGEQVGSEVGIEIAQTKGLARAFNRKFAQTSYDQYRASFSEHYGTSFQSTYNYFKNNPVLSINFLGIIGSEEDGIVQPAEPFSAKFKIINAGGIKSKLTYSVTGDVENSETQTDSIDALSSKVITSPTLASILSTLDDGSSAKLILDVNGLQERLWQNIKRPLEFEDIKSNYSALDGSGMFNVTLANIATSPVNGAISLELYINGKNVKTVMGSPMQPGEKKSYALDFTGLDPLIWINGQYNVELLLKYNSATFSRKAAALGVSDIDDTLVQYFTRLANEKGVVPANSSLDNRLSEVRNLLLQKNSREVSGNINGSGNIYKSNPEATLPGKISRAKFSYTNNSARAESEFTSLADAMAPEAKKFKSFLFIHPQKSSYLELMSKIGGKKYK